MTSLPSPVVIFVASTPFLPVRDMVEASLPLMMVAPVAAKPEYILSAVSVLATRVLLPAPRLMADHLMRASPSVRPSALTVTTSLPPLRVTAALVRPLAVISLTPLATTVAAVAVFLSPSPMMPVCSTFLPAPRSIFEPLRSAPSMETVSSLLLADPVIL